MPKQPVGHHRLEPWLDLQPHLENLEVVSLSLGPDAALYVLAIVRPEQRAWAIFPRTTPDRPNSFVVLRCKGGAANRVEIVNQPWHFHHVQPLPDDQLLLVCSRSRYRGPDDYDLNGHVFNLAGAHQRAFLLGDGIQDIQTTGDGEIWVSYFDEGIFGNFGWDEPIGSSGLICFDRFGHTLYSYSPPSGLDWMADCYALNVAGDHDTWCCYYTDFPLVHLRDHQVAAAWECPIGGSHGFMLYRDMVLMRGGYNKQYIYYLLNLQPGGRMQEQARYAFTDEDNVPMADYRVAMRASNMLILNGTRCYRASIADLLEPEHDRR